MVYALCFYLAFDLVWFYQRRKHDPSRYWFWERLYRTIHVVALILIAYTLSFNVNRVMGLVSFCIFIIHDLFEA